MRKKNNKLFTSFIKKNKFGNISETVKTSTRKEKTKHQKNKERDKRGQLRKEGEGLSYKYNKQHCCNQSSENECLRYEELELGLSLVPRQYYFFLTRLTTMWLKI